MLTLFPTISWLPVDIAAKVVSDLLLAHGIHYPILHLENPVRQPFKDVVTIIEQNIGLKSRPRLAFPDWLDRVRSAEGETSSLMEFFENHFLRMSSGSLVLDTKHCQKISPTLDSADAVTEQFIKQCVEFWTKVGMLKQAA